MKQKKAVQILRTFSDEEWRACYKFLKYCSQKDSRSLQIFEYLYKNRKNLDSKKIDQQKVIDKLFDGLSEKTFLNRLSDLTKDLEQFMVFNDINSEQHSYRYSKTLSEVYMKKGLYKYFEQTIQQIQTELDKRTSFGLFDHLPHLEIHHALYFSDLYDGHVKPYDSLEKLEYRRRQFSKNLEMFYQTEMYSVRKLFKAKTYKYETSPDKVEHILNHLNALTSERNPESFHFLEKFLIQSGSTLSSELNQVVLLTLINHTIYEIKRGNLYMKDNMASLYLYGLNNSVLLHHGKLSETRFLNIVDAISNSNLQMSPKEFISEWIDKASAEEPTTVENLAYAMWSFAKENYTDALRRLSIAEIKLKRINISQRVRWIQICSLCSLYPQHEAKEETLNAANAFFKRHKLEMNEPTYKASLNLLRLVKLIWNNEKVSIIQSELEKCDFIVLKAWINRMINKKGPKR